ncbi:response regulator transcription factor [Anaerolineales bacterium HSG24]|nr:response regulator transcription factor [Anaerolineales bacterium HSG24]
MPTILIIEDDPAWLDILSEIVEDVSAVAHPVSSYADALNALKERRKFALAIVDMSLSLLHHDNRDGLAVLQEIAASYPTLPAIVVTGYATVDLAVQVLAELKAVHFFRKDDFDRRKFITQVKAELGHGETKVPAQFQRQINPNVVNKLSVRELEVFYRLGQGQTNKEIAVELFISVNTVKKHVQSIFTKLNVNNRAEAVRQTFEG